MAGVEEPLKEFAEGLSAMTYLGFFFGGEFGEGLVQGRKEEERIVAEAVRSTRVAEDDAWSFTAEGGYGLSIFGEGDGADESSSALHGGNVFEVVQKLGVIFGVGGVGVTRGSGVACRDDAGESVKGIDFKAGVVGENGFAVGMQAVKLGFLLGVAFEGGRIFFDGWQRFEIRNGFDTNGEGRGRSFEVA